MVPSTDLGILGKEESAVSGMHELPWEGEIEYILQVDCWQMGTGLGWISLHNDEGRVCVEHPIELRWRVVQ